MIHFASQLKIFLATGATDLRKSFNSLSALVRNQLQHDPLSGHLFVFCNRSRNRIKVLFWERGGYWVCAKRLEKGTFHWPQSSGPGLVLTSEELMLLLGGIDLKRTRRRRWHEVEAKA